MVSHPGAPYSQGSGRGTCKRPSQPSAGAIDVNGGYVVTRFKFLAGMGALAATATPVQAQEASLTDADVNLLFDRMNQLVVTVNQLIEKVQSLQDYMVLTITCERYTPDEDPRL